MIRPHPSSTLFPYTTLFRSRVRDRIGPPSVIRWSEVRAADRGVVAFHEGKGEEPQPVRVRVGNYAAVGRSEEHTSELQSLTNLVCRLLLEKKKKNTK